MKPAISLLALSLLLAGCGHSAAKPSVLQVYQSLRPQLRASTLSSVALSLDATRLNGALSAGHLNSIRARDLALRRDALALEAHAGTAAAGVRPLDRRPGPARVHAYLDLVLATLTDQWAEADRVIHLADTVWWDPWLLSPSDARAFGGLAQAARSDAAGAVTAAAVATDVRRRYGQAFRFVPVPNRRPVPPAAAAPLRSTR